MKAAEKRLKAAEKRLIDSVKETTVLKMIVDKEHFEGYEFIASTLVRSNLMAVNTYRYEKTLKKSNVYQHNFHKIYVF